MTDSPRRPIFRAPAPTLDSVARDAATAIAQLCATVRDAGLEVDARGGKRAARVVLPLDRETAARALEAMYALITDTSAAAWKLRVEVAEMAEGCRGGFAREAWALRVVQIAGEAMRAAA